MSKASLVDFPNADYYDCLESEELTHESPEEAVEYWLDNLAEKGVDILTCIRQNSPCVVAAYNQEKITEKDLSYLTDQLLEKADEYWLENYAGPDVDEGFSKKALSEAKTLILPILKTLFASQPVWNCVAIGEVSLDATQIEAMMRRYNPHWFDL